MIKKKNRPLSLVRVNQLKTQLILRIMELVTTIDTVLISVIVIGNHLTKEQSIGNHLTKEQSTIMILTIGKARKKEKRVKLVTKIYTLPNN